MSSKVDRNHDDQLNSLIKIQRHLHKKVPVPSHIASPIHMYPLCINEDSPRGSEYNVQPTNPTSDLSVRLLPEWLMEDVPFNVSRHLDYSSKFSILSSLKPVSLSAS